jgi:hypothetical protein
MHRVESKYSAELQRTTVALVVDDDRVPFLAEDDSRVICLVGANG